MPDGPISLPEEVSPKWTQAPLDRLGTRVWAVLGGGGLKGLAHVGAWQAIEESGLKVSGIVGTSIRALVGALIASGMGWTRSSSPHLRPRRLWWPAGSRFRLG
ncbi:MAG: hypothetical protein EXR95_10090 [Gemmatimonadetes bacterium]|nr:hypothetical protein [Gemmatimonadota bacterium]